jgi:hypothetical protein
MNGCGTYAAINVCAVSHRVIMRPAACFKMPREIYKDVIGTFVVRDASTYVWLTTCHERVRVRAANCDL